MAGFLYYIAGHQSALTAADLKRLGLDYVSDDDRVYNAECGRGPDGGRGWLLADERRLGGYQPDYHPDEQQWRLICPVRPRSCPSPTEPIAADSGGASTANPSPQPPAPSPAIYVGYYQAAPPTRQTLARREQLPGFDVELGDGLAWRVPLVRHCVGSESRLALPTYVDVDDAGRPIPGEVVAEHRHLVELVAPFWDAWLSAFLAAPEGESFAVDLPDLYPMAAGVLAANYAVGLTECALLKLFRSDYGAADVLRAACDTDFAMLALVKKKAPPESHPESPPDSAAAASPSNAGAAA